MKTSRKFKGISFSITGKFNNNSRKNIKNMIVNEDGIISNKISKNLDYLIVGEHPGSKLVLAKMENITIITEDEFLKLAEKI